MKRSNEKNEEFSNQTYFANHSDEGKELVSILIQNWNLRVTVAKRTYPIKFMATYVKLLM